MTHAIDDHVTIAVPYGQEGEHRRFTGIVEAYVRQEGVAAVYKIRFDDPLIYGGTGVAWVTEDQFR